MLFAIICTDRADSSDLRARTRDAHIAYLDNVVEHVVHGGPLLDPAGTPTGSLIVVDVADADAAEALAAADPYALAGLFADVVIRKHRLVYSGRARVG